MTARLAIGFNPVLTLKDASAIARKAEALGYESIWFHESLYQRDVFSYLAAAISSTSRIRVGSGAVNTFTRHPVTAAATFASLSELSGGRVNMGLGLGSFPTVPKLGFKIFPVAETRPLKRIMEYVRIVKGFWAGERLSFKGEFFTADDIQSELRLERPVPLYIASLSEQTLRFAGSDADGAILSPALGTTEVAAAMVGHVREGETRTKKRSRDEREGEGEATRERRHVDKASYLLTSVDPDGEKARDVVRGFYFFLYQLSEVIRAESLIGYGVGPEALGRFRDAWKRGAVEEAKGLVPKAAIDALSVAGTREEALERIRSYRRVGVDLPILMPIGNVNYAIESLAPD